MYDNTMCAVSLVNHTKTVANVFCPLRTPALLNN